MPFITIKGQNKAINYLKRTVAHKRLAHALLFSGPEGIGKKTAALALAQVLNCANPMDNDACGVCLSCKKIMGFHHPDVQHITADGQSIKIDQIREDVQRQVMLMPLEGKYKVYIIDPAESLTLEAANSLLKILEEPPVAVVIILLSAQPFSLLDTIRSRCQEVRFNPVNIDELTSWLVDHQSMDKLQARTLAMLSGGRPAEAIRLSEPDTIAMRKTVLEVLHKNEKSEWSGLAEILGEIRSELPEALGFMLSWFRDLLLINTGGSESLLINNDYKAQLQEHANQETITGLEQKCRLIITTIGQLKRNINIQLLLEVLLMKLSQQTY